MIIWDEPHVSYDFDDLKGLSNFDNGCERYCLRELGARAMSRIAFIDIWPKHLHVKVYFRNLEDMRFVSGYCTVYSWQCGGKEIERVEK